MKSFGSFVYCFSLLLVDLARSYDPHDPSDILAQSYAQRRNNALPHRTLNPAGMLISKSYVLILFLLLEKFEFFI